MELGPVLKRLFPGCDVFPGAGGVFSVVGLARGCVPQDCQVLARAKAPTPKDYRREYFLVRAEEALLFFRICTASQWAGNEELAIGEGAAFNEDERKQLETLARERIAGHCGAAAS